MVIWSHFENDLWRSSHLHQGVLQPKNHFIKQVLREGVQGMKDMLMNVLALCKYHWEFVVCSKSTIIFMQSCGFWDLFMKHSHQSIIMFLFQMKLKRTHKASEGTLTWDVAVICTSLLLLFHLRMLWARPSFAGSKCLLWLMCFGYHRIKSQLESPDFLSKITVPFSKPTWAIENNHVSEEIHLQMVVFFPLSC